MPFPFGVLTGILDLCKHGPTTLPPGQASPGHGHSPELGIRSGKLPFPWHLPETPCPVGLTLPAAQGSCEAPGRENRRGLRNCQVQCLGVLNALMPQDRCLLQSSSSACSPAWSLAAGPSPLDRARSSPQEGPPFCVPPFRKFSQSSPPTQFH